MTDKHHKHGEPCHPHSCKQCDDKEQPPMEPKQAASETAPQPHISAPQLELEQLRRDLAEYKDKYLRALAESENGRKRLQKEKHEMIQYARKT